MVKVKGPPFQRSASYLDRVVMVTAVGIWGLGGEVMGEMGNLIAP